MMVTKDFSSHQLTLVKFFRFLTDSSAFERKQVLAEDDIEQFSKYSTEKVDELVKDIELCQKSLTDKYVSQLTHEVTNNCHIQ